MSDLDRVQELRVLEAVAGAANAAATLEAALEVAVARLGEYAGWPLGHAWLRVPDGDTLRSSHIWHVSSPDLHDAFRAATGELTFQPGEGLPGRVLGTGKPAWVADVPAARLPREAAGIAGAFAFPIVAEERVVAVLEFFSRETDEPDERLMGLTARVAEHLSHVVERTAARDRFTHQALHDTLTGLPNRTLFEEQLSSALARAQRRSTFTAVLFLDLDGFKAVNDTLGHRVGDELLRQTARRLRNAVRAADGVARFGGDEFAICCEDLGDERHALTIAETVQAAIAAPGHVGGDHGVTTSIGVAIARDRRTTAESLLRDADMAMYRAKELGRGCCEVFDDRLREEIQDRLQVERELRDGIERGQLRLLYQPVVDLGTRRIVSVEALVRWQHPQRGLLGPGEFLPVAEECGLILGIGGFVLRAACRQAALWRRQLGDGAPLPVNVNLSARQLGQRGLTETVREALEAAGARPEDLGLEITESAVIENTLLAADTLDALKDLGVRVLLDDFGTGYSSLSYLQRLPIDVLKIDRAFIAGLGTGERGEAIVAAIVGMAQALGMRVVAEGVETVEQAACVRALGCDMGQGFLFDRPLQADQVAVRCGLPGEPLPPARREAA